MTVRERVVVVSGSVGAGHDGVAHELARRLRDEGLEVDVVDLLQGFPLLAALVLGSGYLLLLRHLPWLYELTCRLVERSRLVQRVADAVCCSASPWLLERVARADLVVATYPPAGRALGRLKERGELRVPVITYLTDPAPNFLWVHPAVDLHLAPSTSTAEEATRRYGVAVTPAGPLVSPVFRTTDREAARAHLRSVVGAAPDAAVALVLLGSLGFGAIGPAVGALRAAGLLPVVLCGRNDRLLARVRELPGATGLPWRTDTAQLVVGADLVVHNAGGLALTESLVAGLPCVSFAPIAGHGRANARTLEASGAVPWARSPAELTGLAQALSTRLPAPHWAPEQETAVPIVLEVLASRRART